MRIRKYKSDDKQKISYLVRKCIVEVNSADYTTQQIKFMSMEFSPAKVHERFSSRTAFVAVDGDKILGCATFKAGEIGSLFVNPRFHHQGIGHKLMNKAEEQAKTNGFSDVWVNSSKTAVIFYKNLGYIKKKRVAHRYGGVTFVMEKVLAFG